MRVLRVSHSAVVDAWRERERELRRRGVGVRLVSARAWDEAGRVVPLVPRPGEDVVGVRTFGTHPALFLFDPVGLWRELGRDVDVLDVHEEPYALATLEVLTLRRLRRLLTGRPRHLAPFALYSAQNIEKRYPPPFRWFERAALRRAAALSVCNVAGEIAVRKGFRGVVRRIPLGFDPDVFHPAAPRQAGPVGSPVRVGYAGRLVEHKGVRVLLEAVETSDELRLDLVGDGPLRDEVAARAARSDGRITVQPSTDAPGLAAFYRSVDVLAVPSLVTPGWVEQFGRVVVEAMACGTPVVATSTGALPDVVGDAGLLVPPDDAAALRAALERVGREPALADRLRAAGIERATSCTWAAVADDYEVMYRSMLGDRTDVRDGAAGPRASGAGGRDVEVVVVAYHRPDLLARALAPVAGRFPVTVVDNSSSLDVAKVAADAGVRYLDPGRNGGFAAGVNHALGDRLAPDADVLLLNPDAVVAPDDVRRLSDALAADPRLASVGPRQVDDDGAPARVAWPFPTPGGAWLEAAGLGRLRTREDFVIGSVLLLRGEALADVGPFDETFFLYAEETDWARRAASRGWRHAVVRDAVATHAGGATSSDETRRERTFHASQERYYRKHFGRLGWQAARGAALAGSAVRGVVLPGERGAAARRRVVLYARGPAAEQHRANGAP
ncbi:glycosyltransferase [Luteimicrobium sp. NPDC057192]|uniref:glycosyltransferase n=1 Tax=Luteimicrobium sp. NPDC057192 TaxID=3346042 RepID=UPI00362B305F